MAVAMANPLSMFDHSQSPPGSVLLCDVPFLEGDVDDFPFPANTADVPDDLLACTPVHGWDTHTPPDSPCHEPVFGGESELLASQVTAFFEAQLHHTADEWNTPDPELTASVFEWTPPSSPSPEFCDDFGISLGQMDMSSDAVSPKKEYMSSGSKRKASSMVTETERKKNKVKAELDRAARTEACEQAVAELSSNDEDPESRRHTHNVLERKRRNDLKNSYQLLRECLPALEENERAPTGQILLHAVEYIASLDKAGRDISSVLAEAKLENKRLRSMCVA